MTLKGVLPGGGHGYLLQYSCLENPYGQRSLVGYSPWGCIELDMTEVTKHKYFTMAPLHNSHPIIPMIYFVIILFYFFF